MFALLFSSSSDYMILFGASYEITMSYLKDVCNISVTYFEIHKKRTRDQNGAKTSGQTLEIDKENIKIRIIETQGIY